MKAGNIQGKESAPEISGERREDWRPQSKEKREQKEALAVRQRLKYLLKKESLFEAQISQLQEEVKALREAFSTAVPSQPAAKKMPRQPDGPPPKKAKAAAKAVSQPKTIIVKCKGATPAARRAEPSS